MTLPRILLFGRGGQVTTELIPLLSVLGELTVSGIEDCSFEDPHAIESLIQKLKPTVVLNGAAYTAVDQAESEPALAHAINATAVARMAESAKALGSLVVHYSTDYVFDGQATVPYLETDTLKPCGVYGRTKAEGEALLRASGAAHLIFRTAWVYSSTGKNFMKTMLNAGRERPELRVVCDQRGCPTSAKLLATGTAFALQRWLNSGPSQRKEMEGTFHLVSSGICSWHEFAKTIFEMAELLHKAGITGYAPMVKNVAAISTSEYPTPARRPAFSALNNLKFQDTFGLQLPDWKTCLLMTLEDYLRKF